jgi:5-methyltetrahydrofolate--homocysteine methyltransferase
MNLLELAKSHTVTGDGAMGTELQKAGLPIGRSGESWNLDAPHCVKAIHRAYAAAGSEVVLTNSFGANRWVLGRYGLEGDVEKINRAAAAIARDAVGSAVVVLGDIGPCGGFLRPLGDIDPADLESEFRRQAEALLEGGVDGIIVETMSSVQEVTAGVQAARAAGARVVVGSLAFDRLPNGSIRTMMGVSPSQAAQALVAAGADVIGANCGTNMTATDFASVVEEYKAATGLPVFVQANAGSPELIGGAAVYRLSPQEFASGMREVRAAGASLIGGCCGTTPAHIQALRRELTA